MHGSHSVHSTVIQNRQNLSKNLISIKNFQNFQNFLYIFFSYLSTIVKICPKSQFLSKFLSKFPFYTFVFLIWVQFKFVLEYIGQDKITALVASSTQWAKSIKICPKSLIFPKVLKSLLSIQSLDFNITQVYVETY